MAVNYIVASPGIYLAYGVSADAKPVNPLPNCLFFETDTGNCFKVVSGAWSPIPSSNPDWAGITNKPSTFPPSAHNHDAAYEAKDAAIQSHVQSSHAPANAQKNSDITKAEIEAKLTGPITSHSHATAPPANSWDGIISAAIGNGDPQLALSCMLHNPVNATPTNIGLTVARIAYFRLPANLTVNKIRFFGVGATTNVYRCAIYNGDTLARLTAELPFTTAAQAWGSAGSALNVTLTANQLYFIAVSVNSVGTTAGVQCISGTTGRIGVLPKSWPGSLDIDSALVKPFAFAQFAVTAGALPATAPTIALQAAWTGGFPSFFCDSNNA